jgi:hypothetical protein
MATERGTAVLIAAFTLAGAIAGGVTSEVLDYFKTKRLRHTEARIKAVEIGWNQSVDAFQRLFGLRAKLKADLWSYRDAEIYTRYYAAAFNRDHDKRDATREAYFLKTIDDYAMRVVDDRAQMQSLLGWFDYVLPQQSNPIAPEMKALINLNPWPPPDAPHNLATLESWLKDERGKADQSAVDEVNQKFDALQTKLKQNQQQILSEPTRKYIALLNDAD